MVGRRAAPTRGVTYLALLVVIAVTGAVLGASATVWSTVQQRERERELLWAGEQIRAALRSYAAAGGGRAPARLEDLLEDARTPVKRRHLRAVYADPMTGRADWVLLRDARGGIVGVHSRSLRAPLKTAGFAGGQARFAHAASYADWQFVTAAAAPASAASATSSPGRAAWPARWPPRDAGATAAGRSPGAATGPAPDAAARPAPDPATRPAPDGSAPVRNEEPETESE